MKIDYNKYHWIPKNYRPYLEQRIKEDGLTEAEAISLINECFTRLSGLWAWISPTGEIFRLGYACHDWVAIEIFGVDVRKIEVKFGRVTELTWYSEEKVFKWVERPTKKQIEAYYKLHDELKKKFNG